MANEKRLIDANALIFHLGEEPMVWSDGEAEIQERNDWRRFKACVEAQDTVDAEPVFHGRWVKVNDCVLIGSGHHWECSVCRKWVLRKHTDWHYCPNCGAKMDGERREDE